MVSQRPPQRSALLEPPTSPVTTSTSTRTRPRQSSFGSCNADTAAIPTLMRPDGTYLIEPTDEDWCAHVLARAGAPDILTG